MGILYVGGTLQSLPPVCRNNEDRPARWGAACAHIRSRPHDQGRATGILDRIPPVHDAQGAQKTPQRRVCAVPITNTVKTFCTVQPKKTALSAHRRTQFRAVHTYVKYTRIHTLPSARDQAQSGPPHIARHPKPSVSPNLSRGWREQFLSHRTGLPGFCGKS